MRPREPSSDPQRTKARLGAYVRALLARNEHVNLTAAASPGAARDILVEPSLAVAAAWDRAQAPRVAIDIGSGNGFPGVAVAALWPDCQVTLVERRRKKALAIQDCLATAGIENACALACDARELKRERPALIGQADLVTLRAVTSLEEGNRLAAALLAPGGYVVHWKRPGLVTREARAGDRAADMLALERRPDVAHGVDGVLVVYARTLQR